MDQSNRIGRVQGELPLVRLVDDEWPARLSTNPFALPSRSLGEPKDNFFGHKKGSLVRGICG